MADFIFQFPKEARIWHDTSNYIIILSVPTEQHLRDLSKSLGPLGINHTTFKEPDIGSEITALALCPGPGVKKFCQGMPLALCNREVDVAQK